MRGPVFTPQGIREQRKGMQVSAGSHLLPFIQPKTQAWRVELFTFTQLMLSGNSFGDTLKSVLHSSPEELLDGGNQN